MQIPLPILSRELPSLSNFIVGKNLETVEAIRDFARVQRPEFIKLSGRSGSGVSHLLQAGSFLSSELNFHTLYLSLREKGLHPEILHNLGSFDCLYIDDIDEVYGDEFWEEGLFHLFNQCKDAAKSLMFGTHNSTQEEEIKLADLRSRIEGMLTYSLKSLSDDEKILAIIQKFESFGLTIQQEVAQYLLTHMSRDMRNLMNNIEKLDHASLSAQRAITIPFIKKVMGW